MKRRVSHTRKPMLGSSTSGQAMKLNFESCALNASCAFSGCAVTNSRASAKCAAALRKNTGASIRVHQANSPSISPARPRDDAASVILPVWMTDSCQTNAFTKGFPAHCER